MIKLLNMYVGAFTPTYIFCLFLAEGRSRETVAFRSGSITHSRRDLMENRNC
jgi:hypothetical protein